MKNKFSQLFLSKGVNYFSDDMPLQAILGYLGFQGDSDLDSLGRYISEEFIESLDYIDHYGKPVLKTWGVMGERIDYVRLSPEHRRILQKLQDYGIIRKIVNGSESIFYHFVSGYVVSDSGIFCTFTLTAQTAYAVKKYSTENVRSKFLPKFADSMEPWFGATFYSEIQAGSDLGANRTAAAQSGNGYVINGSDKHFASNAGIADAAVVTARTDGSVPGAKGISVFLVPAIRENGELNYNIRRLKDKLGTVAVPTGEVEFRDSEAYLLGSKEFGIYIAMEILTISRIDDAIAAVGIARKAFWEACLYAHKRTAFGKKLAEHELMIKDLVEMESDLEAALVLSLLSARKFELSSGAEPPYNKEYDLARMLGSIAKNIASEISAQITRYSMEIMGGIGFMEEFPVAKFHRDSVVTSIWEGTSNIQALELLEVIVKKKADKLLRENLEDQIKKLDDGKIASSLLNDVKLVFGRLQRIIESGEGEFHSKEILTDLGNITASIHMFMIGQQKNPGSAMVAKGASVFYARHFHPEQATKSLILGSRAIIEWMVMNK